MDLNQKTYFLITGASRGIGQTMAIQVATKLKVGSVLVLLARNNNGLAKTKLEIEKLGKHVDVQTYSIDLSVATPEQFHELLQRSLEGDDCIREAASFERAFIIHNAASLGDVSKRAIDVSDTTIWTQYYQMNLFSAISLNCEFFRFFKEIPKLVVNLSSKCAIEPFQSASFYCSVKAARDMYFRVLAEEEADTTVLNYAPGAIDTDMSLQLQQETFNKELSTSFMRQRASNTMLTSDQTTEKFLKVLEERKFKSGDHVDYWD